MTTVQNIINDSAIEIGILVAGSTLAENDEQWVLRKLNYFLNTLSRDGFSCNVKTRHENLTIVGGTSKYTIGSGGDYDLTRPLSIDSAFIRENGTDYGLTVKPMWEWDALPDKSTRTGRPYYLFYNPKYELGEIQLYPNPTASDPLFLTANKVFDTYLYAAIGDDLELSQEYEEMIVLNLSVRIAGRYGRQVSSETKRNAITTLYDIKSDNFTMNIKGKDFNCETQYDIEGDTCR